MAHAVSVVGLGVHCDPSDRPFAGVAGGNG